MGLRNWIRRRIYFLRNPHHGDVSCACGFSVNYGPDYDTKHEDAIRQVSVHRSSEKHWFCPEPDCDVVYVGENAGYRGGGHMGAHSDE